MIDSAVGQVVLTSLTPTTFSASSASLTFSTSSTSSTFSTFSNFLLLKPRFMPTQFSQETLVDLSSISARTDGEEDER